MDMNTTYSTPIRQEITLEQIVNAVKSEIERVGHKTYWSVDVSYENGEVSIMTDATYRIGK